MSVLLTESLIPEDDSRNLLSSCCHIRHLTWSFPRGSAPLWVIPSPNPPFPTGYSWLLRPSPHPWRPVSADGMNHELFPFFFSGQGHLWEVEEKVKPLNNLCHFIFNVTLLRQSWHMWTPRQAQTWRVKQGETMSPSLTQSKWYVQRLKEGNRGSLLGEGDANGTFWDPALGSASNHCFPEHSPLPVEWDEGDHRLSKLAPKAT